MGGCSVVYPGSTINLKDVLTFKETPLEYFSQGLRLVDDFLLDIFRKY